MPTPRSMSPRLSRPTLASILLVVAACQAPSIARRETTGCTASCPGAPRAAIGDAGASLRGAPAQPAPVLEGGEGRAPSSAAYLCPMHPDIGSDEPGRCPQCHMKLVPRSQVLEHDHGN